MPFTNKIAVITNVLPQYREDMYARLFEKYGDNLQVYCQPMIPGMNLNTVHDKFKSNVQLLSFFSLQREALCWQRLPFFEIIKNYKIIFIYGNPRVISNVFYSILFKLLGKKVVVWGQFHTASSNSWLKSIRLKWWAGFKYIFLYTDREAEKYKQINKNSAFVTGMNNGVNQTEIHNVIKKFDDASLQQWKSNAGVSDKRIILSCARLEEKNKYDLLIDCLPNLVVKYPDLLWCVIGDGAEKKALQARAQELHVDQHIKWLGAIYTQEALAPWFLSSECLVHPGAIGLSLMHSMGYGLPVVTHDNEDKQMPEIAALVDGVNGLMFSEGDTKSLTEVVYSLLDDNDLQKKLSSNAFKTIAENYNTEKMAEKFITMVNKIEENM